MKTKFLTGVFALMLFASGSVFADGENTLCNQERSTEAKVDTTVQPDVETPGQETKNDTVEDRG